jgi:hypothetical protein
MPYINKLDTDTVTINIGPLGVSYILSPATFELNNVVAYFTYVQFDGVLIPAYTTLVLIGTAPIVVNETYVAIDLLINP